VIDVVKWARQAGFENLNLDLIFGLPSQTLMDWQQSIDFALRLNPEHLSLYSLTIEEGTPLHRWYRRGLISKPDEDTGADMYEWSMARLEEAGFEQYEISNWARKKANMDLRCRHNLQYWRNQPYFGFGAGAHGRIQQSRMANVRGIRAYIQRCNAGSAQYPLGPAVEEVWPLDRKIEMQETMLVGLRLTEEGVSRDKFFERFQQPVDAIFGGQIDDLVRKGLLENYEGRLRLTRRGRLLGNLVFMQFVGDD
jgi:oxygen-independent coproporphyrinogen-3 oxidase